MEILVGSTFSHTISSLFTGKELPEQVFRKKYDSYVFINYDLFVRGDYFSLFCDFETRLDGNYFLLHTLEKKLGEIWGFTEPEYDKEYPCIKLNALNRTGSEWNLAMNQLDTPVGFSYYAELCFNPVLYGSTDKWAVYLHKFNEIGVIGYDQELEEVLLNYSSRDIIYDTKQVIRFIESFVSSTERLKIIEENILKNYK